MNYIKESVNLSEGTIEEKRNEIKKQFIETYELDEKLFDLLKEKELKPYDIPSSPHTIYKLNGWNGIKDWLGTSSDVRFLSFEQAKEYVTEVPEVFGILAKKFTPGPLTFLMKKKK